jgi:hypothetical protein
MSAARRRHTGMLVRRIFEILQAHPQGLHFKKIVKLLETNGQTPESLLTEQVASGCVAPIKAGWLLNDRDVFAVSPKGVEAYKRFPDPTQFMIAASRSSFRGWLSVYLPHYYYRAGKLRSQVTSEYQVVRRVGVRRLLSEALGRARPWEDVLPLQSPRRVIIDDVKVSEDESLMDHWRALPDTSWGRNAIYLSPVSVLNSDFRVLTNNYPPGFGIKIVKNPGGVNESNYVTGKTKGDSLIQLGLVHSHRHLMLVANLLYLKGIGPRLYDLVELECNGTLWTAYVVEHVDGTAPSLAECEKVIGSLKELEQEGLLQVILPDGFDDEEFECPGCSGNTVTNQAGECKYVDFQNFRLVNYQTFLTALAVEASKQTHYGDSLMLRGGRYLYQSIPGVRMPGKRNIEERVKVLVQLLDAAGVSISERLVLDVGCNIGMMMAQYLRLGAAWCHGLDRAKVVPHTDAILTALGCTRFSVAGADLDTAYDLEATLPSFLEPSLDGCVISYLAVRAHVGWLKALSRIPWSVLIYEGHEGETEADFDEHMAELKSLTGCQLGGVSNYVDGDSEQRTVALLLRNVG